MIGRLQGEGFIREYTPTPQIQVANIQWNYNQTNDIIKVEIWDVVDKSINPSTVSKRPDVLDNGLKIENSQATPTSPRPLISQIPPDQLTLDAATINVYRNTHGVILMFDMTKSWTFDYAVKALQEMPENVAVIILRVISQSQVHQVISEFNRKRITEYPPANMIRYVETSMLSGIGLDHIYKYFGVPFLQLQRDILRQQLNFKTTELTKLLSSLDVSDDIPGLADHRQEDQILNSTAEDPSEKTNLEKLPDEEFKNFTEGKGAELTEHEVTNSTSISTTLPQHPKETTPNIHIIEDFDAGELEDDFFNDAPDDIPNLPKVDPSKLDYVEEAELSNPMVTVDEDLAGVDQQVDEDEGKSYGDIISTQSFNRDFDDVWRHRHHTQFTSTSRITDSSDEDLVPMAKRLDYLGQSSVQTNDLNIEENTGSRSNLEYQRDETSLDTGEYVPMTFGTPSGYEEISEGQDNPWLEGGEAQGKEDSTLSSSFVSPVRPELHSYEMFGGQDERPSKPINESDRDIIEPSTYSNLHLTHPHPFLEQGSVSGLSWGDVSENSDVNQTVTNPTTESTEVSEYTEDSKKKVPKGQKIETDEDGGDISHFRSPGDPTNPAVEAIGINSSHSLLHPPARKMDMTAEAPIIKPPITEANKPNEDTPPLVPGGTWIKPAFVKDTKFARPLKVFTNEFRSLG
ncbi:11450_t:CDS:10 [Acaulospora colombiana]|uniref:11450_t:CDS:1 n=1 Tax=Acaulospora colombiana TaxID=27376 RepID=A0ACA9LCU7_9GLOM|nr:11450_t:CDS:10 [Acaulospora colombiana]